MPSPCLALGRIMRSAPVCGFVSPKTRYLPFGCQEAGNCRFWLSVRLRIARAAIGRTLHVRGLDAIDGTPLVDIKPVFAEFLPRKLVRQPAWSDELMRD